MFWMSTCKKITPVQNDQYHSMKSKLKNHILWVPYMGVTPTRDPPRGVQHGSKQCLANVRLSVPQCGKQTRKLALRNHCGPKITILAFEFLVSKSPLNVFKYDYYTKIEGFGVESKI